MLRLLIACLCFPLLAAAPAAQAQAQERVTLGFGSLFTNDRIGDGLDRWRTGSYSVSAVSGYGWNGQRPAGFGDIVELRFRTEIVAPGVLYGPGSDDRPYAGMLTYGVHTHMALMGGEASIGVDVTAVGPQTGLADFQDRYHDRFSAPRLSDAVIDGQIADGLYPSVTAEYGYPIRLSDRVLLRPFVELQAGVEDLVRVGGDMIWGPVGQRDLLIRDSVTGWLYRATHAPETGFSVVAGADWAQINDTILLPPLRGYVAEDDRIRARIGVNWQSGPQTSFFYGMTWLSEEFVGQPEGQLLGSISVRFRF